MAAHGASVTVNAPLHQVYQLYTHFNDYPKFMTFVKEVTYLDDQRSHWVVDVVGKHEWDAVNEGWVPDRRIGWRSVDGLKNSGAVIFESLGPERTKLTVEVEYEPPAGPLGALGEALGAGGQFERRLQNDLEHFATMVEQAPPGALDPTSSAYLFHAESAAGRGETTVAQNESMGMAGDAATEQIDSLPAAGAGAAGPLGDVRGTSDVTTGDPATPRVPGTSGTRELS
ncbi:MAG: hypothetical protein QOI11_3417 [Candidatus Eremiobacteraeota bacterium]|jgi:ribosome-associated toxin RatA of RatAB toxin-antitoxin module|nr:hypothetical protein [Candidatus Eremiobacteraeota bacterium]